MVQAGAEWPRELPASAAHYEGPHVSHYPDSPDRGRLRHTHVQVSHARHYLDSPDRGRLRFTHVQVSHAQHHLDSSYRGRLRLTHVQVSHVHITLTHLTMGDYDTLMCK